MVDAVFPGQCRRQRGKALVDGGFAVGIALAQFGMQAEHREVELAADAQAEQQVADDAAPLGVGQGAQAVTDDDEEEEDDYYDDEEED